MSEKTGQRPAWAYTLSAAVIAFALSAVLGIFETREPSELAMVITVIAWILGAGGATQFFMSRRE